MNSVFDLNSLLNKAVGVRIRKKINESKTLGMILLKMLEIINHILSIIIEASIEKTPKPVRNNDIYNNILLSKIKLNNNNPKTIVNTVKEGLDFIFIKIKYR